MTKRGFMEKTVLIVEDNPMSMQLTVDLVRISGYEAIEATDGRQAVEIAREKKPDLILLDIQLPVMSGLEAAKKLKAGERTSGIPIIALTAGAMKGDEEKIYQAGCDEYMTKPIDTREFIKTLGKFIG